LNHSEPAQPIRTTRARRGAKGPQSSSTTSVTLSWTPATYDGARLHATAAAAEIKLTRELDHGTSRTWICSGHAEFDWIAALCSARCSEVVLTARLGDNLAGKHIVLELAELLTFRLTATQPLIRVFFLPTPGAAPAIRHHHA